MRIAIIGSGVSGLVVAHLLHPNHDISVFEARDRVGGHVSTIDVRDADGSRHAVDTGFIVYNEYNYPLFSRLLQQLGVASRPSNMSFGVRSDRTGLEYSSANLNTLFAQRRNLLSPRFYTMIRDILRFNRMAGAATQNGSHPLTVGEYVSAAGFSPQFTEDFVVPMGSALWSMPGERVLEMPLEFFVSFFDNHGMLTVSDQPEWRVIEGGSRRYVDALITPFQERIRTSTTVHNVERRHAHVEVDGETFDHVIFACHADQAMSILAQPSQREREILSAFPFQKNEVVLHSDTSVLPRSKRAWASWNYHVRPEEGVPATVTYNMNKLQTLQTKTTYCVTLNATDLIDPESILHRTDFSHPTYTHAGIRAQGRHSEISGIERTHFCGAYWGYGFHEDGVRSAVRVAERFGVSL